MMMFMEVKVVEGLDQVETEIVGDSGGIRTHTAVTGKVLEVALTRPEVDRVPISHAVSCCT